MPNPSARETGLPTIAVGLITEPEQAEAIVASGQADLVALARGMLYDPRWPWHAAAKLGATVQAPVRVVQDAARQRHQVRLAARNNRLGLLGLGDKTHRNRWQTGFAANGFGKRHLVVRPKCNLLQR